MEEFRHKVNHWFKENYGDKESKKNNDYFCPLIKQMCLGKDCALWIDDVTRNFNISENTCSINVVAKNIMNIGDIIETK